MGMLNNPIYRIKIHREAMEIQVLDLGPPWAVHLYLWHQYADRHGTCYPH